MKTTSFMFAVEQFPENGPMCRFSKREINETTKGTLETSLVEPIMNVSESTVYIGGYEVSVVVKPTSHSA